VWEYTLVSDEFDLWINQGLELQRNGRLDEAESLYRRVVNAAPAHLGALNHLTQVLEAQLRQHEAIPLFERAIRQSPHVARLRCALADVFHARGDLPRAVDVYRTALELEPTLADAWWGLGCASTTSDEPAIAADCFRRFVAIRPEHGLAWHNLGDLYFALGQIDLAIDAYRTAARNLPPEAQCKVLSNIAIVIPGSLKNDNQTILDVRRTWASRCLPPFSAAKVFPVSSVRAGQPRTLRIGYVSAFFSRRNWMKPVWGLIHHHDRDRFEVHIFADGPEPVRRDGFRANVRDQFHNTSGLSNAQLARMIEDRAIDVLVDLNSFSRIARLPLFALRPAPVQLAWFNLFATSGMGCFDALVGDRHVIPPAEESFYTETIIRVAGSYLSYNVPYPVPNVAPPPCLERGHRTFGCLAPHYKINTEVIESFSRILRDCTGSQLLLKNTVLGKASGRDFVSGEFARFGIPRDRLLLEGPDEHYAFLERYRDVDIALDTFPYNGGTTTSEAIWQGVPVLAFVGDRWAARISASLLREAGLAEFVSPDRDAFVAQAIALARDPNMPARLAEIRRMMRNRISRAPVSDVAGFARNMEAIYLQMWLRYQTAADGPIKDHANDGNLGDS
jgi:predicted O-linked N-acetylglucosamine transferase (SPINDLY family)